MGSGILFGVMLAASAATAQEYAISTIAVAANWRRRRCRASASPRVRLGHRR